MTRRFTESAKWCDPWFRALKPEYKLAWLYLLDNCDIGGFIDLDSPLANFQVGFDIDWERFFVEAGARISKLTTGKLWLNGFVEFQQGTRSLNESNNCHRGILKRFAEHGINPTEFGYTVASKSSSSEAPSKGQARTPGKGNSKGRGKGKDSGFDNFYDAYPKKTGKDAAKKAWERAIAREKPAVIIAATKAYAASDVGAGDKQFVKNPATWLNAGCWDDDRAAWSNRPAEHADTARRVT